MKLYINRKKNLLDFHSFLLHKKILNTFEVIALLLKANIFCSNFLVSFYLIQSRYSMKSNLFNCFIAIGSNSLKKKHKTVQSSHICQKKLKETPKNGQNDQISRIFGISRQNLRRTNSKSI